MQGGFLSSTKVIEGVLIGALRYTWKLNYFHVIPFQLQDQIINGSLPCPKEEAALLASIQLCVEENWPNNKRTQTIRRHLLKGQFGLRIKLSIKHACWV